MHDCWLVHFSYIDFYFSLSLSVISTFITIIICCINILLYVNYEIVLISTHRFDLFPVLLPHLSARRVGQ